MSDNSKNFAEIEKSRREAHLRLDQVFDGLLASLDPSEQMPATEYIYKDPSDEDCRDPRNKIGQNLTPEGAELLFRMLDKGAGYNSAGRRLSITQSAVKNRKKDWEARGGVNRQKLFIPYMDRKA